MEVKNYNGLLEMWKELNAKVTELSKLADAETNLTKKYSIRRERSVIVNQIDIIDYAMSCIHEEWNNSSLKGGE